MPYLSRIDKKIKCNKNILNTHLKKEDKNLCVNNFKKIPYKCEIFVYLRVCLES